MSDELLIEAKRFIFPRRTALKPNDYDDLIRRLISRVEASQLAWTDAKPTVPGLWLYRLYPDSVPLQWCVFNVVELNGQLMHDVSEGEYEPLRDDGQFAGPIPTPADTREGDDK